MIKGQLCRHCIMLLRYVDWLQVVTLTGILAVPFAPLMLIIHGASLQMKGIPANQVCPSYPHPYSATFTFLCTPRQ